MKFKQNVSFTLVEAVVTVVLVGTLAAVALVNFNRTIEKQKYKTACLNLIALNSVYVMDVARYGDIQRFEDWRVKWPDVNSMVDKLNNNNEGFTYNFRPKTTKQQTIATRLPTGWEPYSILFSSASIAPISDTNPHCMSGPCP